MSYIIIFKILLLFDSFQNGGQGKKNRQRIMECCGVVELGKEKEDEVLLIFCCFVLFAFLYNYFLSPSIS